MSEYIIPKKKEFFIRLFNLIPDTLNKFKYLNNEATNFINNDKKIRYNYLNDIYHNIGLDKYYDMITFESPDFYDDNEPSFLFHFETFFELNEWIISGLNKNNQDKIFNNIDSDEEDFIDSP